MEDYLRKHVRYNFIVNVFDGGFFGLGLGFASFVTVLPLFVSHMTDSALLIGLIPAIRGTGWQLPQLFVADRVARANRYKPMVILLTLLERIPFLGFAFVALFLPALGTTTALVLTFALLVVQGLGGGVTSPAWQSMIARVIPPTRRGTFFGAQGAASSLLSSVGAVGAGILLERIGLPVNFAACFFITVGAMIVSWFFLAQTREPTIPSPQAEMQASDFRAGLMEILRRDANYRWFLFARMLFQFAMMSFAFYTVYVVSQLHLDDLGAGLMTSVFMGAQIIANPVMGWIGDRVSHRLVMEVGGLAAIVSALLAWWAPSANWFYLVFICAGIANVAAWTITMAMTIDFAPQPSDRPVYVGLANTLVAPSVILAPLFGGWLADTAGYSATFFAAAVGGIITTLMLHLLLRDPPRATG